MSRTRLRVERLADIRGLRAVVERLAEARASGLMRASREQQASCRRDDQRLERALDDWHSALTAPRFDPMATVILGQAVDRQDRTRTASYRELDRLTADLGGARQEHGRAQAGHRCASELLDRARRRHRRQREERALAELDDSYAARVRP